MKNLKNLGKSLSRTEQKAINGGLRADPRRCRKCGGFPTPNGGCLIQTANECCLTTICQ